MDESVGIKGLDQGKVLFGSRQAKAGFQPKANQRAGWRNLPRSGHRRNEFEVGCMVESTAALILAEIKESRQ